jgi:hypothetical protein
MFAVAKEMNLRGLNYFLFFIPLLLSLLIFLFPSSFIYKTFRGTYEGLHGIHDSRGGSSPTRPTTSLYV